MNVNSGTYLYFSIFAWHCLNQVCMLILFTYLFVTLNLLVIFFKTYLFRWFFRMPCSCAIWQQNKSHLNHTIVCSYLILLINNLTQYVVLFIYFLRSDRATFSNHNVRQPTIVLRTNLSSNSEILHIPKTNMRSKAMEVRMSQWT